MIVVTTNITLEPISVKDSSDIFNLINSERLYLREWLPFVDATKHESDTQAFVESVVAGGLPPYKIVVDGKFVGIIGFINHDSNNLKIEIGYWLSQKMQGCGIMTRSVKKLLEYAFSELEINRVQIKAAIGNTSSRKIPERLNFIFEGVERDGELLVDNKYADLAVYSILKKEFTE